MSDSGEGEIEVISISEERIETVLWSQEELDGFNFTVAEDGTAILHGYGGPWTLHLFLFTLAWTMAPDLEPNRDGYEQTYNTLARLTMDMTHPVADLDRQSEGYSCKLPNIRILPRGASRP